MASSAPRSPDHGSTTADAIAGRPMAQACHGRHTRGWTTRTVVSQTIASIATVNSGKSINESLCDRRNAVESLLRGDDPERAVGKNLPRGRDRAVPELVRYAGIQPEPPGQGIRVLTHGAGHDNAGTVTIPQSWDCHAAEQCPQDGVW